jgi:uncharacterized protein Usg
MLPMLLDITPSFPSFLSFLSFFSHSGAGKADSAG